MLKIKVLEFLEHFSKIFEAFGGGLGIEKGTKIVYFTSVSRYVVQFGRNLGHLLHDDSESAFASILVDSGSPWRCQNNSETVYFTDVL